MKKQKTKNQKSELNSLSANNIRSDSAPEWPNPNPERPQTPADPNTDIYALDIRDAKLADNPKQEDWGPYAEPKAPEGAPNILYIVIDDTGFGAWSMFGGKIQMPNLKRIANKGLIYTNFHTTALCSPTRSSLLNGRNANSNGMACIEEATSAFPGSNGRIPRENALIAETLGERGYNTYCIGKWHLCPEEESNMASTKRNWPLGRGFERYYGFLGGETDQWYPDLVYDNHLIEPPYGPNMDDSEDGYHLSKDLVDKAISFIQDGKAIAPTKPWMMYFCPGANHAPHQIWPQKIVDYDYNSTLSTGSSDIDFADTSIFAAGYEQYRTDVLAQMQELEIFDSSLQASPLNPHGEGIEETGDFAGQIEFDGKPWPQTEYVKPWNKLENNEKALFIRMAETYAAFSTYTDEQIGRLLTYLENTDQIDNTIIIAVADNGASGEGGPNGSVNENLFFNDIPDSIEKNMELLADLGTDKTYNHYPTGWAWAFDTPFKYWKRWSSYEGGDATPFMMCGPGINRESKDSGFRKQYVHAIDLVPTLYELLELSPPATVKGYSQNDLDGKSFAYTFDINFDHKHYPDEKCQFPYRFDSGEYGSPTGNNKKETQFYAMLGTRGIWHKGWHACTFHPPTPSDWGDFDNDRWELYCMDGDTTDKGLSIPADPLQLNDLHDLDTASNLGVDPRFVIGKLQTLTDLWNQEANKYFGKPLDDRSTSAVLGEDRPQLSDPPDGNIYTYYPGGSEIPEAVAPNTRGRSYSIAATVDCSGVNFGNTAEIPSGVLFAHGGRFGGHSFYIHNSELCYTYNWLGQREQKFSYSLVGFTPSSPISVTFKVKFSKASIIEPPDPTFGSSTLGTITMEIDGNVITQKNNLSSFTERQDQFLTQPGKFALCGEGMNIGRDGGQPVPSDAYASPGEFEGAIIKQVNVWVDLKDEEANEVEQSKALKGMLWRD